MKNAYHVYYYNGICATFICCEGWTRQLDAGGEKVVT